MTGKNSNPPRLAIWWLRHACPGSDNEALTGDLIERFREGQTHGWFWRQVFIAFAVGVLGGIQRRWPHFCYAIVGFVLPWFFRDAPAVRRVPEWLHWADLPWPWSQLAFRLSRPALLALAALPALAAALVINRSFRWISLLRVGMINLALIALQYYLFAFLFSWLTRPMPGNPYGRVPVIPLVIWILWSFSTFLVAAWIGCRPVPHAGPSGVEHEVA
jgi:hypothetical protein